MLKWIESTGKSEEAAIEAALQTLGMDRDEVSVEILERAKSGFLGIGSTPARVKRMRYSAPRTSAGARSTSLPVRAISSRARAAFAFNPTFAAMDALLLCIRS